MKKITLTRGKFAKVDDLDYARAKKFKWQAERCHNSDTIWYATRNLSVDGKRKHQKLHRFVLDAPFGKRVDHIDGDGLNCQRYNLRYATASQNQFNTKRRVDNKSGHKGVHYRQRDKYWIAQINVNKKPIILGYFRKIGDAVKARREGEKIYHGEFTRI